MMPDCDVSVDKQLRSEGKFEITSNVVDDKCRSLHAVMQYSATDSSQVSLIVELFS